MKKLLSAFLAAILCIAPARAAIVQFPFQGILFPGYFVAMAPIAVGSNTVAAMAASTQKIVYFGRVYQKDKWFRNGNTTKNLSHVSFSTNTSVCAACTSTVQVDIEGVSVSAGPPGQPDGVILSSGGAVSTLLLSTLGTAAAWKTGMPNFTTPPAVTYGQLIAVVWSFSTYSAGTLNLLGGTGLADIASHGPNIATFNGTTWAAKFLVPNITLEFDDGTIGTLSGSMPYVSTANNDTFNSGSSPNEYGMTFSLPFNYQIDALCANVQVASASSTFVVELTDMNGNVIATTGTIDGHTARATGGTPTISNFPINVVPLKKNVTYFVGVRPLTANNVTIPSLIVGAANHWDAGHGGAGQSFAFATRNGGVVSAITATKRPDFAVRVSAIDDGTGPSRAPVYNSLN